MDQPFKPPMKPTSILVLNAWRVDGLRSDGVALVDECCDVLGDVGDDGAMARLPNRAPAPEVIVPALAAWPATQSRPTPPTTLPLEPRPTMN